MYKKIIKMLTKSYKEIPLFWVGFNLNYFREYGEKNSCMARIHPDLKDDEYIKDCLEDLIDYVRVNYDMEKLVK